MPFVSVGKTRLFFRLEGREVDPVLVLSHSIGTDHAMWAPQVTDLLPHFRILRYDTRGHGASDIPPGEYSVADLGNDVVALLDALNLSQVAFCGLSLGGAVGQWLALSAPDRLSKLILASTSPRFATVTNWEARIQAVARGGMAAVADLAMQRFFAAEFAAASPFAASIRSTLLGTDAGGYIGCCAALRDFDSTSSLKSIKTPTLVIVGDQDVSTPWEGNGEIVAREISNAQVVRLPAAHLSNLETPRSFTAALAAFLQPATDPRKRLEAGFKVRRMVLGDAHVDRAIASTTEFNRDFQELITGYAWGTIWNRPGLDLRTRRLLVLAMMAALGRWEEFRMHLAAGLRGGLEANDIKEVLLQAAIYAGVPAANTGFHVAREELERYQARGE
jgi:3-oxoadipate enol-lactonase/4-carboxymuconolactone decarboxylase